MDTFQVLEEVRETLQWVDIFTEEQGLPDRFYDELHQRLEHMLKMT